ncbi:hypothetical protein PS1_000728 [Malus domestica]
MRALIHSFSVASLTPTALKLVCTNGPSSKNQNSSFQFSNGFSLFSSHRPFPAQKLPVRVRSSRLPSKHSFFIREFKEYSWMV